VIEGLSADSLPTWPFFHAFHLWGETRFQQPPPFPLTTCIGIRMNPDTHECSRRHSRLLQVKPNASKPCRYFDETKTSTFIPCCSSYPSIHVTSGQDLKHSPYEILVFHLSGVFTPLDFKYFDVRSHEMAHLDRRLDFH
jgi:hypothetical protein